MKDISKVEIIFENCQVLHFEPKDFMNLIIEDIETKVGRCACNSISKMQVSNYVAFCLFKEADKSYDELGCPECKDTKLHRMQMKDITSIDITYKDKTVDSFYVNWNDEDEYTNSYQRVYENSRGDVVVIISKKEDFARAFDKKMFNDAEAMQSLQEGTLD